MTAEEYRELVNQWIGFPNDRGVLAQIWTPEEIEEGRNEALRETGCIMQDWRAEIEIETAQQIKKYMTEYPDKKRPGEMDKLAEVFAKWYGAAIKRNHVKLPAKMNMTNTEGGDVDSPNLITMNPNVEAKGIRNFITRSNDGNCHSGSLTFELFDSNKPGTYAGWLLSLYDLKTFNEIKREHTRRGEEPIQAVMPDEYVFVLMRAGDMPFATVVFDDVPKLAERLYSLCPDPDGWGLNNLRGQKDITDGKYWSQYKTWSNNFGIVVGNNWQVPLEKLKDLATVTMIVPDIDVVEELNLATKGQCPVEVAAARLNNLKWLAGIPLPGTPDNTNPGCGIFDPATFKLPTNPHAEPFSIRAEAGAKIFKWDHVTRKFVSDDGQILKDLAEANRRGKELFDDAER